MSWPVNVSSIRGEQHRHLGAGGGVEVVLGDQGNDLVTVFAPSECWMHCGRGEGKKDASGKYALWEPPGRHQVPTAIGSIRLASLFLTLPTRLLTGQHVISSAG
jgi:hypothetical protein